MRESRGGDRGLNPHPLKNHKDVGFLIKLYWSGSLEKSQSYQTIIQWWANTMSFAYKAMMATAFSGIWIPSSSSKKKKKHCQSGPPVGPPLKFFFGSAHDKSVCWSTKCFSLLRRPGREVIKLFSSSTQLSMKFIMLKMLLAF